MSLINGWELVVGLEVHAQILSKSKLFSGAGAGFCTEPNSQVGYFDAGFPGMLPVINGFCVEQGIRSALGLKAKVHTFSVFDRKNYFYPDLPCGYQISQYSQPLATQGQLELHNGRIVGIKRIHLEMDAGKNLHDQHVTKSYVDLNRSGVGLMEIVSEPELYSAKEAAIFLRYLRTLLRYLRSCDGNMEEGSLRCDANVSVHKPHTPLGTRCEIKNLNSLRFVQQAIDYEARRQISLLEQGGYVEQQTRLWDPSAGVTRTMRSKEEAHDYRYFPDPDLLPLTLDPQWIETIRQSLPELPGEKKKRLQQTYGLSSQESELLAEEEKKADFFEIVAAGRDPKRVFGWVTTELFGALNQANLGIEDSPVKAHALGELIDLITKQTISGRMAKEVFEDMFQSKKGALSIIHEKGLRQITDTEVLQAEVEVVVSLHPDKVEQYCLGKEKLFGFFVGQVMKRTQGKANPQLLNQILHKLLEQQR